MPDRAAAVHRQHRGGADAPAHDRSGAHGAGAEALRPLVVAGLAKDPALRPADGAALVAGLRTAAGHAYGPDWEQRGRSRLAEAALLLAALWPAGGPARVHGSTVHQVSLRRRLPHRHLSATKAAIAAGIVIAGAAAGTALAARPLAPVQRAHDTAASISTGCSTGTGTGTGTAGRDTARGRAPAALRLPSGIPADRRGYQQRPEPGQLPGHPFPDRGDLHPRKVTGLRSGGKRIQLRLVFWLHRVRHQLVHQDWCAR